MHDRHPVEEHASPAVAVPLEPGPAEYAHDDVTPIAVSLVQPSPLAFESSGTIHGIPLTDHVLAAVAYSRAVVAELPPGITWGDFCAAVLAGNLDK